MIRIAHISDLHLHHESGFQFQQETWMQTLAGFILKRYGVQIEVSAHDPDRLVALENALIRERPHILVVTGDLATYGDRPSLRLAAQTLQKWAGRLKEARGDGKETLVLCVPGNHDAFEERFRALKARSGWRGGAVLQAMEAFHRDFEAILRPLPGLQRTVAPTPHLDQYREEVEVPLNSSADPGAPISYPTPWGLIRFFLFNSVNDPGWMANEGRIGAAQYNRLNAALATDPDTINVLQIALLHHHPLPIPYTPDSSLERFYNAMQDGSTLCHFLNERRFHLVLHGHQHHPYTCQVLYPGGTELHVVAAGTATQAGADAEHAGFNILDVVSPFQTLLRRFEYREDGFHEVAAQHPLEFAPQMSSKFTARTLDEQDFRTWLRPNSDAIERDHAFELITITARAELDGTYVGEYRLRGKCLTGGAEGIRRSVTGSPEMSWDAVGIRAWQTSDMAELTVQTLEDHLRQKTFLIKHQTYASAGDTFDYGYRFEWKNLPPTPSYFDGLNLYPYEGGVEKVTYQIDLAWKPLTRHVEEAGLRTRASTQKSSLTEVADPVSGRKYWRFSFEVTGPRAIAYLFHLPRS